MLSSSSKLYLGANRRHLTFQRSDTPAQDHSRRPTVRTCSAGHSTPGLRGEITRRLGILNPRLWSRIPEVKTPWFSKNYRSVSHPGRRSGPQFRKPGPINAHRPKSLPEAKPREPAQSLETLQMPAGAPPPRSPSPHAGPALPERHDPGPGGRRLAPARSDRLGRGPRGNGSARRPAPREGPADRGGRLPAARLGPGRGGRGEERARKSPEGNGVRHRPQPLAPGACFQIASASRGRVSFRRPEIRAPPPPRRAHVTAARRRAQPGRRERERERQAPPPGGGGARRKLPALRESEIVERGVQGQSLALRACRLGVSPWSQLVEGWRLLSLVEHCFSDLEPHSNKSIS
ncbi:unnamed protein product [Rangifer tarandus platyrhynchus]|uniref:Uncharacterized protein n=2 Tax=Rangifer tarandus platyrhynchus TaxID=3082113 RepID=A0ACB0EDI2_RANTA|nr:unnamed protein product [Rangifer tarandus platyrhynchus]CAI9698309.1 unnamed protein product [Rangifer tarandus platyrhynchus]